MSNFFIVLFIICFISFWVGMVKPSLVVRWGAKRSRRRVALYYGLGAIIFMLIGGATAPAQSASLSTTPKTKTTGLSAHTTNSQIRTNVLAGVYHPSRLKVIDKYETVSGTVIKVRHESDKDYHINLKLDSKYANLFNSKNVSSEQGDLVVEVIPMDANKIPIPHVGQHITVTGAYVLDKDHGWMEIHPAWLINGKGSALYTTAEASASVQTGLHGNGDDEEGTVQKSSTSTSPSASTSSPAKSQTNSQSASSNPAPTQSHSSSTNSTKLTIASSVLDVSPGDYASITIHTAPGATGSIEVDYESGPSHAKGLYDQTADSSGNITWQWKVGTRTTPGNWPVIISANGQTIQTTVNVQ